MVTGYTSESRFACTITFTRKVSQQRSSVLLRSTITKRCTKPSCCACLMRSGNKAGLTWRNRPLDISFSRYPQAFPSSVRSPESLPAGSSPSWFVLSSSSPDPVGFASEVVFTSALLPCTFSMLKSMLDRAAAGITSSMLLAVPPRWLDEAASSGSDPVADIPVNSSAGERLVWPPCWEVLGSTLVARNCDLELPIELEL
mmetsp:Transcript_30906/g.59655  ORF Transcript_30906/g.59655 Transcript_30906/m.59655 type:complete len:200 (+) Transcript_30906:2958-3557(+)